MSSKHKKKRQIDTSDSDSGPDSDPPPKKSTTTAKPEKKKESSSKGAGNDDKEKMFALSKMRFVSVTEFRGRPMINIREFYDSDGELKPGRKGISLNPDQWQKLKEHMSSIDEIIERL